MTQTIDAPDQELEDLPDLLKQFQNAGAIAAAIHNGAQLLLPPPDMLPHEYAEKNIIIPLGNAVPGPMRFDNAPHQVEPLNQLVNPDCYRASLMWGAQTGKTMTALAAQAYCIDATPMSQMMMQPSEGDLKTWLETKFNPLVESNASLQKKIAKARGRDGVNNQKMKSYPGGFMMYSWSGSPKTMRGRSAPLIVCDEVDGYEATSEGHPVNLLWQRAATFGDARFLLEISTPTLKDHSYIEKQFLAGDQRRFYVICADCGTHQLLVWENVRWDGRQSVDIDTADADKLDLDAHKPETARYACSCCGSLWDDGQRVHALRTAQANGAGWKAHKPFKGHASFHFNELGSVFVRLRNVVQSYLDKLKDDDLQTFVNVSLSQTWAEKGEKVDAEGLKKRAEEYRAPVPAGGVYLTAGIDMQPDRLEVEVVAWGVYEESWSVDYHVLWGDPDGQEVWNDLDDYLAQTWLHESGAQLAISAACLDTGGTNGNTQSAYEYARGKTGRRLFAIKGQGGWGLPVVGAPSRKQSGQKGRKVDLFRVGVDEVKLIVMRRLGTAVPGPGYCHFPAERSQDWYDQLTAEKLVTRYEKGFPIRKWTKSDHARNEALDCRVYALAALKITMPNLKRLADRLKVPDHMKRPAKPAETVPFNEKTEEKSAISHDAAAAVKLFQALKQAQKQPQDQAAAPAEKPHEEPKTPRRHTRTIKGTKRTGKRGGFVRNY